MNKYIVKSRQLTTWNTKVCLPCLPYGSSPWPPIGSFIMLEAPSIALTVQLILEYQYALSMLVIILQIIIFISMMLILMTNPGILPQIWLRYQTDEDLFIIPSKPISEQHRYIITHCSLSHQQKFCQQCQIYRPIRAIHCAACNHCVERYDHHCPWLSICIGKYNYKYFLAYLSSLVILIFVSLIISLSFTIEQVKDNRQTVKDYAVYLLVCVMSTLFILPLGRLLVYHIHLIRMGLTTNQDLKKTFNIINNQIPYQKLECNIYRDKRLPKFSYRNKIKSPKIQRVNTIQLEQFDNKANKTLSPLKNQRQSIFSSLISQDMNDAL